ncbi:metallophosphoesterase [Arenimonas sp. MALMAid1274]|uniref:metallophosphoesterase n=1 Tax=Arenimonas sp. MALMAid1274 TaxID=3411630 RepID=UPI003B9DDDC4
MRPRPLVWLLLAALFAAPLSLPAAEPAAPDDAGPYARYVGDDLELRWVCAGVVTKERIERPTWPVQVASRCGYPRTLALRPRAGIDAPARTTGAPRLAALSDLHGQFDLTRRLLQANGIIDADGDWAYGRGHLVVTGDVFDRGPRANDVLWLLYMLEQQARDAGGAVHFTLGNHESLVLRDDLRYLHENDRRVAIALGTPFPALYGPDTVLGDWLRSKRTVLQVDGLVFVHGGIGPGFLALGLDLDQINVRSRASLGLSRDQLRGDPVLAALQDGVGSPIWYRGYFLPDGPDTAQVQVILDALGAERIVVGHTSQPGVQSRHGGRVIAIDSSIKEGVSGELLLVEDGVLSRAGLDGQRREIPDQAAAAGDD